MPMDYMKGGVINYMTQLHKNNTFIQNWDSLFSNSTKNRVSQDGWPI